MLLLTELWPDSWGILLPLVHLIVDDVVDLGVEGSGHTLLGGNLVNNYCIMLDWNEVD
jgi:hypothetical protein